MDDTVARFDIGLGDLGVVDLHPVAGINTQVAALHRHGGLHSCHVLGEYLAGHNMVGEYTLQLRQVLKQPLDRPGGEFREGLVRRGEQFGILKED